MKKHINKLFLLLLVPILLLQHGCIEETFDTDMAHGKHVAVSDTALEALSNATVAFMFQYLTWDISSATEFGYPAMIISWDALSSDGYVADATGNYDYFRNPWGLLNSYLGTESSSYIRVTWLFYYTLILNAHSIIYAFEEAPDDAEAYTDQQRQFYGVASVFRALAYMDLMRAWEYKRTGIASMDNEADANNIWGLTVNIVSERTEDTRDNPRAPFYEMYRFILTDLNRAERYLDGYKRSGKNKPDLSVVYAYQARLWLEMATRFQKDSQSSHSKNDFQTMLSHENDEALAIYDRMGVSSITDCYQKAAEYARKAINTGGYSPLTETQWKDLDYGFNSANSNSSWMFAVLMTPEGLGSNGYRNFTSCSSNEYGLGMGNSVRRAWRKIDKNLFDQIEAADWRRTTWIAPEDAGKTPIPSKYPTILSETDWKVRLPYVGLKFKPKELSNKGDDASYTYRDACNADVPIIRIEEMYFIEAEALAYTKGLQDGVNALKSFLNTYRYTDGSYNPQPENVDDFVDNHLLVQKRIEFWGEGLAYFDKKRREHQTLRGYIGTGFLPAARFNSIYGYTPCWYNLFFPQTLEVDRNKGIIQNPNPIPPANLLWVDPS